MAQTEIHPAGESVGTPTSAGTGTRATRVLGIATIVSMGWLVAFGLGFSPALVGKYSPSRLPGALSNFCA